MDIIGFISNLFGAAKEFFGFQSKKLDLNNTAEMRGAAERQDEVKAVDASENAVAKKDTDEIRKELAD